MTALTNLKLLAVSLLSISMTACFWGQNLDAESMSDPSTAPTIELTRSYQRVIRYNCDREIQSDEVETVSSPTRTLNFPTPSAYDYARTSYRNLTSGDGSFSVVRWGDTDSITVDYSSGLFNMNVKSGLNTIEYKHTFCQEDADYTCIDETEEYTFGNYYIYVKYEERFIEGIGYRMPTPEECISETKKTISK
ncbi:MAG: hypothetical protein AB8E15_12440 [Bdellovibrionales bacterium]